jgi:hypothetical protein
MADTPDEARATRPFADVLRELDKGRVHAELSDRLQEVLAAVMDVRAKGAIQLTITVTPSKAAEMVEVSAQVTAKKPRASRTSMFFVDAEHNLRRDNPHQPALPLQGLPGGATDSADTAQTRSAR